MKVLVRWALVGAGLFWLGHNFSGSVFKGLHRSRASEAKVLLQEVVEMQEKFRERHGRYSVDLMELTGRNPGTLFLQPKYQFVVGFLSRCPRPEVPSPAQHSLDPSLGLTFVPLTTRRAAQIQVLFEQTEGTPERCPDLRSDFRVFAVGPQNDKDPLEIWSMNAARELKPGL